MAPVATWAHLDTATVRSSAFTRQARVGTSFGAAAEAMRRVLIERARRKQRRKHGGQLERVELDELPALAPNEDLLAIDDALETLAGVDAQAAEFVKLRFFVGLTHGQAAEILGVSRRAADNIWAFARAWLYRAVRREKA